MEMQHYAFGEESKDNAKGLVGRKLIFDIYWCCCNDEDLADEKSIKDKFDMKFKAPMPQSKSFFILNMEPPSTRVSTDFGENLTMLKLSRGRESTQLNRIN